MADRSVTLKDRGFVQVIVSDNGVGMSPDQLTKLFGEFMQFNPHALQAGQGSGLGLHISREIVDRHDGSLVAFSEGLGLGSEFIITLPLWEEEKAVSICPDRTACASPNPMVDDAPLENDAALFRPLKILLVDDCRSSRKLLSRLLHLEGHDCDEARDGNEALKLVDQQAQGGTPYDSILLDDQMPHMDGPSCAKEIRRRGYHTNIIAHTGNLLPEDRAHFLSCGADDILPKPARLEDLHRLWEKKGLLLSETNV